ncbi:hypothetical protein A0O28_0003180 [Trichoderma guizhouense]|uniref:Uncharacterized protein n=1 Tax=Trichoderma guizhouense TaxID=1491466 RepID=A0A1T3CGJ8_9HYPO|nr:hypothetical protein A0O28_0003180 [Trichoderma guizhouense]
MQDRKKKKKSKIRPWRPPAASRRPKAAEQLVSWTAGPLDRWTASRRAAIRLLDGLLELLERRLADHVHGPATARAARFWFAVPKGESHAGRTSNLSRLEAQEQRELSVTGCISVIGIESCTHRSWHIVVASAHRILPP